MTGQQLFALLPLITLGLSILGLLVVVAFHRNLALTCGLAAGALAATLVSTVVVSHWLPLHAMPLIRMDGYALLFDGLILMAALAVCLLAFVDLRRRRGRGDEFFILLLLSTLGAMVLVSAIHFATFVLGLELLSVSIYALIAYPITGRARVEAAVKYLILSGVSSAFLLFGIALVYLVSGTLSFSSLKLGTTHHIPGGYEYLLGGFGMILAGFLFKLSLVPFHVWAPDIYEGAPAPVTAFVATVSKGAMFVLLLRFFAMAGMSSNPSIMTGLSVVAGLSIIGGNLLALFQNNVKRILAYSSIAHMGDLMVVFIAAGVAGGRALATEASAFYLFAYFITTLGAFGVVTIMSLKQVESDVGHVNAYRGLFWRRPGLAAVLTAMLLSLAGIPLTAGFIGKFYVFAAGVGSGLWALLATVIVGSGMGLVYYLRIVFAMASGTGVQVEKTPVPLAGSWVIAALMIAVLILGAWPTPVINLIDQAIALS